jgi:hypothetical protein
VGDAIWNGEEPRLACFDNAKHFDCMRRIVWLGVAFLGLVTVAGAQDAGMLVDKMVAAYGGEAALEKSAAVRQEGKVEATMRVGSSGPIVRTYARPSKLRIQIGEGPKFTEVRVLNGGKGWRNGQEAAGVSYEAMVLQAARLDLPWLLMKHKAKLVDKGNVERDGRRLQLRELPLENGLSVSAGIEPTTGHILFSSGTTKTGSMTFETAYDDFRTVDGVLFAFRGGQHGSGDQNGRNDPLKDRNSQRSTGGHLQALILARIGQADRISGTYWSSDVSRLTHPLPFLLSEGKIGKSRQQVRA